LFARQTPWSHKLAAPHCESEPHSAWQVALMQRNAVPQSVSKVHCADWGAAATQKPPEQASPMPQVAAEVQMPWQEPFWQERPEPHCASLAHSTWPASPHATAPPM
jgi:hypothetical protein